MGIKSGTLRKRLSESIEKKILCRNQLLLTIAYLHRYQTDDKELQRNIDDMENKLAELLIKYDGKEVKEDIQDVINNITDRYIPSKEQAKAVIKLVRDKEYTGYRRYFIKDSLLKFRRYSGKAKSKPKFNRLSAADFKNYIYEHDLIETVLENIDCHTIKYFGDNIRCANFGGDNSTAISIDLNPYLNVKDFTRDLTYLSDTPDIITLTQYNKGLNFNGAILYLHDILGLQDVDLSKLNITDCDYSGNKHEELKAKEAERRLKDYEEALKKDLKYYSESRLKGLPPEWLIEWRLSKEVQQWKDEYKQAIIHSLESFEIKFDNYYIYIPIRHYQTGEIVSINKRRRTIDKNFIDNHDFDGLEYLGLHKYQQTKGYQKSDNIYGLFENRESIENAGYCVIFEAEKSVLKRCALRDNTGLSLSGHYLSDQQADILAELNLNEVVIAFDKDVPIDEIRFNCDKLLNHGVKNVSYIYDYDNILREKDSPADATNKIYKYLFCNRVVFDDTERKLLEINMNSKR